MSVDESSLAVKHVETAAVVPTRNPTPTPTSSPTNVPSRSPTSSPTSEPTNRPIGIPELTMREETSIVFTEDGPPLRLLPTIDILDANSEHLVSCTITITAGTENGVYGDVLNSTSQKDVNTIFHTDKGYMHVSLVLSGLQSLSLVEVRDVLRKVTYTNTADYPSIQPRNISITVRDDEIPPQTSAPLTFVVAVKRNNERPAIHVPSSQREFVENSDAVLVLPDVVLIDEDNSSTHALARMHQLTAEISFGYQDGADMLQLTSSEAKKWEVLIEENGRVLKVKNQEQ